MFSAEAASARWFREEGAWYCASFVFHSLLMCGFALLASGVPSRACDEETNLVAAEEEEAPPPGISFTDDGGIKSAPNVDDPPIEPGSPDSSDAPNTMERVAGGSPGIADGGTEGTGVGGEAFAPSATGAGPSLGKIGGFVGVQGLGRPRGEVGPYPPGPPGGDKRKLGGALGGTPQTEASVQAAIAWIARHQNRDGSWSLDAFNGRCTDRSCIGPGAKADIAATSLGLLPFLGAGITHEKKHGQKNEPYVANVYAGLYWLMSHQKADGDLRDAGGNMYSHGLATIVLCEAFGLTGDKTLGAAAQRAVNFIQRAQNSKTGGWRYQPGDEGDTSVLGWQLMALKSAEMAYLKVDPKAFEGAARWLNACAAGEYGSQYKYVPASGSGVTDACTGAGLLCRQYLGMKLGDPAMQAGRKYLMAHLPNAEKWDLYYWYYATQVMFNGLDSDWDDWNRATRKVLIDGQSKEGCARGSWTPDRDRHGSRGGRLMATSFATLTLEVYYRHLPLYRLNADQRAVKLRPGDTF